MYEILKLAGEQVDILTSSEALQVLRVSLQSHHQTTI